MPGIPPEFGHSWEDFARDWCLNSALGHEPSEVARALSALNRLWHERVARLTEGSARGVGLIASAVDTGSLLAVCEGLESFQEVLQRLKADERSAYSELVLVASLSRLGYFPRFGPPIGGRVLDAACSVGRIPVLIEVVAPDCSGASAAEQLVVKKLTDEVRRSVSKCRVEVEVFRPFLEADIPTIVKAVRSAFPRSWSLVADKARLRRIDAGQALPPTFDGEGAQIFLGGGKDVQDDSTGVIVQWETSDERAKRVFNGEYHQFSPGVANILVVNVSAVSGGMKTWPPLMARLLQPNRNRKVGAVVFFEQGLVGPPEAIRRRWRVLLNPHAHVAIPESLITDLESLDESSHFGSQRLERLVAV
jgi:hypothetical protein